jgi:hypothetical protein
MMQDKGRVIRETYNLTTDQVAAALTETVLRAQVEGAEHPAQGGVLGSMLRIDKAFEGVERWFLRLVLSGIPLAFGIYLLTVAGKRKLGMLAIVAGVLVLVVVVGVERVLARIGRVFDSKTDPWIAKSGGSRLRKAIQRGRVQVLTGEVDAELSGDRLLARAGGHTATIPSIRTAWRSRASSYLVLAPSPPGLRTDFAGYVVLPVGGDIAAAIVDASRDMVGGSDLSRLIP